MSWEMEEGQRPQKATAIFMTARQNALWLCYIFHGNSKKLALLPTYLLQFLALFPRPAPSSLAQPQYLSDSLAKYLCRDAKKIDADWSKAAEKLFNLI